MYSFLLFLFVVNAAFLMLAILMQSNNAGGLSSTFGGVGGAASSTFGTRETASFLHKFTVTMTVSFFVLAIVIGLYSRAHFENSSSDSQSIIMKKGANSTTVEGLPSLDETTLPATGTDAGTTPVEETTLPTAEPVTPATDGE